MNPTLPSTNVLPLWDLKVKQEETSLIRTALRACDRSLPMAAQAIKGHSLNTLRRVSGQSLQLTAKTAVSPRVLLYWGCALEEIVCKEKKKKNLQSTLCVGTHCYLYLLLSHLSCWKARKFDYFSTQLHFSPFCDLQNVCSCTLSLSHLHLISGYLTMLMI